MSRPQPPKRRSTIYLVLAVICYFIAANVFGYGFSSGSRTPPESVKTFVVIAFPTFLLLGITLLVIGIVLHARENRDHMES